MKIFEASHCFPYAWYQVTNAHWQKYPNPFANHVLHVDVLSREVEPESGILRTERIIVCQQNVPSLLKKIFPNLQDKTYAYEVSTTDPHNKVHNATSINLSLSDMIRIEEHCTFKETGSETKFAQETRINILMVSRFASYTEDFLVKRFRENATMVVVYSTNWQGKRGFEQVLERLQGGSGIAAKAAL